MPKLARNRMRAVSAVMLAALVLVQCTDRDPSGLERPDSPVPPRASLVTCHAKVVSGGTSMECRSGAAGAATTPAETGLVNRTIALLSSSAPLPAGLTLGGQGLYVTLANDAPAYDGGSGLFTTNVTVTNLISQALGVLQDGGPATDHGVRVFFAQGPTAVGAGTVTVENEDGVEQFTASGQPYYQYNEVLENSETSAPKQWTFHLDGATEFTFGVYVWAPVEFPDGWVDIAGAPTPIELDLSNAGDLEETQTATVRDALGRPLGDETVTWASSNDSVATVGASSGVVTAQRAGTAVITATAGTRTGERIVNVAQPADVANAQVTAASESVSVGESTTITVSLQDALGQPLTTSGGTVTLASSDGGSIGTVTDNNNGTYTATLTAPTTTGTTTITAKLDDVDITDNVVITFTAGAPAAYLVVLSDSMPAGSTPVTVTAQLQDQYGNNVPTEDVAVVWTSTNGGTFTPSDTTLTDVTGLATVTFTTSAVGGTSHVITATTGSVTGSDDLAVINQAPDAAADSYDAITSVVIAVNAVGGVLANDTDPDGATPAAIADTITTTQSGSVILAADGAFTYIPAAGFTGSDAFDYIVEDAGGARDTATVTLTVSGNYIFVDSANAAAGTGTQADPYQALTAAVAAASANDTIFVKAGTYAGAVTLPAGVAVLGANLGSDFARTVNGTSYTLLDGTDNTAPNVTATVTLGAGNTLRGLDVAPATGNGISGSSFGTLTVSNLNVTAAAGTALSLTTGTVSGAFGAVTGTNAGSDALLLSGVNGTWSMASGTLTGAVVVNGGSDDITIPQAVTQSGAARVATVQSRTAGTITFSGAISCSAACTGLLVQNNTGGTNRFSGSAKTISTATNAAVTLTSNTGATIEFTNGNLDVTTTTGAAITATGGGTLVVTGTGNDIASTTGAALALNGVSLGSGTVSLATLTANGAAAPVALTNVTDGTIAIASGTITGGAGSAIAIAGGSVDLTYNGTVTQANNTALLSVSGGHTGDVNFASGTLTASNGTGLQFDNADGSYAFNGTLNLSNSVGGADAGIDVVSNSGGTFTFNANSTITNPVNQLFNIQGSASTINFSYAGSFTKNNNSVTGILVQNNTAGGTIAFNGDRTTQTKLLSTGTAPAINLATNTGTAISFTGGGLNVTTTTGATFTATGGGTITVADAANTLTAAGGVALNVQNTTIGSSLLFQSISATGGANGIVLSNTGTSGGLTVTGTGSAGSGGVIVNTSGSDGAVAGNGIYLNSTRNVSLSWMAFSGHANNGLYGTGVRGLVMDKVRFTGNNGTSNSGLYDESAVSLENVGGVLRFTNSRFDGGAYNALRIDNTMGTAPVIDSLVVANDTVGSMQGSTADVRSTAVLVNLMDGTAAIRIQNNRITNWWGNAIHVLIQENASGTARITNNFADNLNGALAGAGGIWVGGCNFAYNVSNNTIRHTNGTAISSDKSNCASGTFQGTIDNNTIGVSGDANSGSFTGIGIFASGRNGTSTVRITNNVLRQINGSANGAITTQIGDAAAMGPAGTLNATISGNDIQESGTTVNNAQHGILVTHGTTSSGAGDTHTGCYDILNNTIINFTSGVANNRIRVNQRFGTTSRWPGYSGAATGVTSGPDMASYLLARNTASTSTNANSSTGGFLNTIPAGSACPQPSM